MSLPQTAFETNSPSDDLIIVGDEAKRELLLLDNTPQEPARDDSPKDDVRERQKIISRHLSSLAEHQRHLADLNQSLSQQCNG